MKKTSILLTLFVICFLAEIKAQTGNVGIGTLIPDSSAVLDIQSPDRGILIPRMTNSQIASIANPAVGLQVYSLDDKCLHQYDGIQWVIDCALKYNDSPLPPVDGSWTQLNDFPPSFGNRYGCISFILNGEAYVGTGRNSLFNKDLWKYNPTADSWTQLNDFPSGFPGRRDAITFTIGGEVYVGAGQAFGYIENDLWKYNPIADSWTQLNDFPFAGTREAIAFTINDVAYFGTGARGGQFQKDLWKYDPITDNWTQMNDFPQSFEARADATAFSLGDIAYVGTGSDFDPLQDFWKYNATTDSWTQLMDFPVARYAVTSFVLKGEAYIGTGQTGPGSGFQKGLYKYNAAADEWLELTDFPAGFVARSSAIAFTLGETVYLGTGLGGGGNDLWEYDPFNNTYLMTVSPNGDATWIDPGNNNVINVDDADADPTNELQEWSNLPGIPVDFSDDTDDVNDADADPNNETITSAILNGTDLEITEAGSTKTVDLSSLTGSESTTVTDSDNIDLTLTNSEITAVAILDPDVVNILSSSAAGLLATESDPEVGDNATNYLPKWDGISLVQSTSVFEDGMGNVGIGLTLPTEKLHVNGNLKVAGTISGITDPTEAQDAATKAYVDALEAQVSVMNTILLDAGYNGTVSDTEGNVYKTIKIGNQIWMAENLNIGTMIAGSGNQTDNATIEKYCYDDITANCDIYGGLYQWNEMMQYTTTESIQGICPTGWHLPSDDEIKTLEMTLGMTQAEADMTGYRGTDQGSQLAGNEPLWTDGSLDENATFGSSGFTDLPGGDRGTSGLFFDESSFAYFWSSSQSGSNAWYRYLVFASPVVNRNVNSKSRGFSVRCVQDD